MRVIYTDGAVTVWHGYGPDLIEIFKVKIGGRRAKTFRGEMAWADHERYVCGFHQILEGQPYAYSADDALRKNGARQ